MGLARYILNLTENTWQEEEIARLRLYTSIHQEQRELGTILEGKLSSHLQELSLANSELTKEIGEREKTEAQVHSLTQELIKVQEIERKRIALDLHDNVAQELSAIKENGIPIAIDFTSVGMDRLSLSLDYDIAVNIDRLVQEALNNIKKHAGASHAKVRLLAAGSKIILLIEDDDEGCGLIAVRERSLDAKRLGLLGMQERVKSLSGSIQIISSPHQGMQIFTEIPWKMKNGSKKKDHHC